MLPPHDKYCIVIDAEKGWFFFINSNPPPFRKARALAVELHNYEATFLSHTSYVDTTSYELLSDEAVRAAMKDPNRHCGALIKSVREKIVGMVASHEVLSPGPREIVLNGK